MHSMSAQIRPESHRLANRFLCSSKNFIGLSLPNPHLCVTSRPEVDILSTLEPLAPNRVSLPSKVAKRKTSSNMADGV